MADPVSIEFVWDDPTLDRLTVRLYDDDAEARAERYVSALADGNLVLKVTTSRTVELSERRAERRD